MLMFVGTIDQSLGLVKQIHELPEFPCFLEKWIEKYGRFYAKTVNGSEQNTDIFFK